MAPPVPQDLPELREIVDFPDQMDYQGTMDRLEEM